MKVVDEKGKLFGKLNIIDLLVIVLLLVAVVLVVFKVLAKDGAVGAQHTVLTYTVEVKGVDPEVYEGIKAYVPGENGTGDQLMANGSMGGGLPPPFSCLENKKEIDGYGGNSCWK